jgi:hypothetical protein
MDDELRSALTAYLQYLKKTGKESFEKNRGFV